MADDILALLARTRRRLNARIAAHRALAWAAPAAVGAALLAAALRALGAGAAGLPLCAAAIAACSAAGALSARKSLVDLAGAARWLDGRLADEELLAASLACLVRPEPGRFDEAILARAGEQVPRAAALRPSRRPLAKRAAIAAAACAVGAYVLFLAAPLGPPPPPSGAAKSSGAAEGTAAERARTALFSGGSAEASAFASSLFPGDRRQATLAERALREGRIDDLRDMLRAAELDYASRLSRAVGEPERRKLAAEQERLREAANALAAGREGAVAREGGGGGEEGGSGTGSSRPFSGGDRGAAGSQSPSPGSGGASGPGAGSGNRRGERGDASDFRSGGEGGSGPGSSGEALGRGGQSFGIGSGIEGDWGRIEPASGAPKKDLPSPKDPSLFELVLPGQAASAPISGLVPDSRRSAESAMARMGLPLEYEEFVRSYFLALSKGESR